MASETWASTRLDATLRCNTNVYVLTTGGLASHRCRRHCCLCAIIFDRRDLDGKARRVVDDASSQAGGRGDERQECGMETHAESERKWAKARIYKCRSDEGSSSKLNWAL